MLNALAGLDRFRNARLAVLAGGVSAAALIISIAAHDGYAAAVSAGSALIATGALLLAVIERSGRKSAVDQLHDAIEPMPEGIAFFDAQDRAVVWNSRYAELVDPAGALRPGVSFHDLLEINVKAGAHPDAVGGEESWIHGRMLARDRLGSDEHQNGDRWVRAERRRTRDGGLVTIVVDVTDFHWATEVLAQARDSAEAANRAKSEFLANVSHELRTPLNGVLGIAELLAHTRLDDRQREMVETIRASGATLDALVSDIIDLARLESGKIDMTREAFDVGLAIHEAATAYRIHAGRKGIGFHIEVTPDAEGMVIGDSRRLRQILGNLISNAVKFTDAGGVTVTAMRPDPSGAALTFTVRDSGVGFDDEVKATIFERFSQGDGSSTRRFGGTGLGLAICKQAAGLMGGGLDCDSVPGEGSAFTLTLNLPPSRTGETDPPAEEPAAEPANDPGHALRVLVVDDHPTNRRVVEMILDQVGAERVSVENGQEALEAYLRDRFDVVLMDIQMPVMDGLTATRGIRLMERENSRPSTPVIILSANAMPEHIEAGRAAGANRHLAKPISAAALLSVIAEVANEAA